MSVPFRFIHASDFHLDRPPRGLAEVPDHLRPALIDAPYRAAERVFDAALKENADFVVLAGDLIDPAMAGPRGLVFLGEQFRRLLERGIRLYWALGRSDRLGEWTDAWPLPEGVVRFTHDAAEHVVCRRGEETLAEILGAGSGQRKRIRLSQFHTDSSELFSVAVAHGAVDADALARRSINYWALGGEHGRRDVLRGPAVAHYCGSPQGRRPQEAGPHGCTLVEVDEQRQVRTRFIPTDAVRYLDEQVVVNESTTPDQLFEILGERTVELLSDPFGPELLVRWVVGGSRVLATELRHGKLAGDLVTRLRADHATGRPGAWTISLAAETTGDVPEERYEEQTLLGEFLRTVRHYHEDEDEPLDLTPYLSQRHAGGSLASTASLEDPSVRRRVLDEVARLGVELLSPQEPRP